MAGYPSQHLLTPSGAFQHGARFERIVTNADGDSYREEVQGYFVSQRHAAHLVGVWNKLGADPSPINGLSYKYRLLT